MKIRLYVQKTVALKAGLDKYGYSVVEVPAASLSPEQRNALAKFGIPEGSHYKTMYPEADFYLDDRSSVIIEAASPEVVYPMLDAIVVKNEEQRRYEQAKIEEKNKKAEEYVQKWLVASLDKFVFSRWEHNQHNWQLHTISGDKSWWFTNIPNDPRLKDKIEEARAYVLKKNEEETKFRAREEQRKKDEEVERARLQQEGEARLKAWAIANGSELLKARIEFGFTWMPLAQQEFCDSCIVNLGLGSELTEKEGYSSDATYRKTPTLDEIRELQRIQSLVGKKNLPLEVKLIWVTYTPEAFSEDEAEAMTDDDLVKQAEFEVEITCPDGEKKMRHFPAPWKGGVDVV